MRQQDVLDYHVKLVNFQHLKNIAKLPTQELLSLRVSEIQSHWNKVDEFDGHIKEFPEWFEKSHSEREVIEQIALTFDTQPGLRMLGG